MKYLVMLNSNSDFRYVPIKEFISYIESRYIAHREECEARNNQALFQSATANSSAANANLHLMRAEKEV